MASKTKVKVLQQNRTAKYMESREVQSIEKAQAWNRENTEDEEVLSSGI
jgi:hypothetical protein